MEVNIGEDFRYVLCPSTLHLAATIGYILAALFEYRHHIERTAGPNTHENELHGAHSLIIAARLGWAVDVDKVAIWRGASEFDVFFPLYGSFHQKLVRIGSKI